MTAAKPNHGLYVALVHHPVRDRHGSVMTSAVTNIDVHDIARSCCTFGVAHYFVVTPVTAQQMIVTRILEHWSSGDGARRMPERTLALSRCSHAASLDDVSDRVTLLEQKRPTWISTEARSEHVSSVIPYAKVLSLLEFSPVLLLFGTAHGLHPTVLERAQHCLPPIDAPPLLAVETASGYAFNHLSVRAAAAITLDRITRPL